MKRRLRRDAFRRHDERRGDGRLSGGINEALIVDVAGRLIGRRHVRAVVAVRLVPCRRRRCCPRRAERLAELRRVVIGDDLLLRLHKVVVVWM